MGIGLKNKSIFIALGVVSAVGIVSSISKLRSDIKKTNLILDKITKQIGIPEEDIDGEIKTFVSEGNKIKAIKRYRDISGAGLKEAKEYIDNLM